MDDQEYRPARETVRLRHPHTGDIREVEATPEEIVPLMGLGYQQVKEDSE
jgi:hypothetical protein